MTSLNSSASFVKMCAVVALAWAGLSLGFDASRHLRELRKEVADLRSRVAAETVARMQADTEVWSNLVSTISGTTKTVAMQNRILHELVLLQTLKKEK